MTVVRDCVGIMGTTRLNTVCDHLFLCQIIKLLYNMDQRNAVQDYCSCGYTLPCSINPLSSTCSDSQEKCRDLNAALREEREDRRSAEAVWKLRGFGDRGEVLGSDVMSDYLNCM